MKNNILMGWINPPLPEALAAAPDHCPDPPTMLGFLLISSSTQVSLNVIQRLKDAPLGKYGVLHVLTPLLLMWHTV